MSDEAAVTVSAVLVSWNTGAIHDRAIDAFRNACGDLPHEVVVVDNGSTDGTVERLTDDARVCLVPLDSNTGFTHAANVGVQEARGQYVLFLNPDAEPAPGAIARLVEVLEGRPDAWGATPLFLNPDGSPQPFYLRFPDWPSLALSFTRWGRAADRKLGGRAKRRRYYLDRPTLRGVAEVDCVGAACLLVRREEFLAAGAFDERFVNFFQDGDYARRMQRRKRKLLVVADTTVMHEAGATLKRFGEPERDGRNLYDYLRFLEGEPRWRSLIGRAAVALDLALPRAERDLVGRLARGEHAATTPATRA